MTGRMSLCVVLYKRFTHGLLALISACFDLILGELELKGGNPCLYAALHAVRLRQHVHLCSH